MDGSVRCEEVSRYSTPELGYVVQLERAELQLAGQDGMSPSSLRVTMIFRREGDAWRVVHRHADPITTPQPINTVLDRSRDGEVEVEVEVEVETLGAAALFVRMGAEPHTDWLCGVVAYNPRGYVLTGTDVPSVAFPLDRPGRYLGTSMPGVFAVGDVQQGSTKRVATS